VWSSAIVAFILIAGHPPLKTAKRAQDWWYDKLYVSLQISCSILFNFGTQKMDYEAFWRTHRKAAPHLTSEAIGFLSCALVASPGDRATIDELLAHEWMRGPSLNESELRQAMEDRFCRMQQAKEAERLRAARMRGDSIRMRSIQGPRYTAHEGATEAGDADAPIEQSAQPRTYPSSKAVSAYSNFYMPQPPQRAVGELERALNGMRATVDQIEPYSLRCDIVHEGDQLQFNANLYAESVIDSESGRTTQISFVELVRQQGDFQAFNLVFKVP
jgi:serine/threonine protein kinase